VFRIAGKGITNIDGHGRGDEYVVVKAVTPTNLSNKEKDLLRQFERLRLKPGDDGHE
jgi:molecular chaperone DnaJ